MIRTYNRETPRAVRSLPRGWSLSDTKPGIDPNIVAPIVGFLCGLAFLGIVKLFYTVADAVTK